MREKMLQVAAELATRELPVTDGARREAQEFLRWAASDHFTFLGYREYRVKKQRGEDVLCAGEKTGLGLLRGNDAGKPRPLATLAARTEQDPLILTKTNSRATVHRPGYMDYIGVLDFDRGGKPVLDRPQRVERFELDVKLDICRCELVDPHHRGVADGLGDRTKAAGFAIGRCRRCGVAHILARGVCGCIVHRFPSFVSSDTRNSASRLQP
jgi:hypothetical protein